MIHTIPAEASRRRRSCEAPELTIEKAVRKAIGAGYRRGQVAVALAELACQLVEVSYDDDRDMAMAAMARRLRMLRDDWAPGDAVDLAAERAAIIVPDPQPKRLGCVPRCLWGVKNSS